MKNSELEKCENHSENGRDKETEGYKGNEGCGFTMKLKEAIHRVYEEITQNPRWVCICFFLCVAYVLMFFQRKSDNGVALIITLITSSIFLIGILNMKRYIIGKECFAIFFVLIVVAFLIEIVALGRNESGKFITGVTGLDRGDIICIVVIALFLVSLILIINMSYSYENKLEKTNSVKTIKETKLVIDRAIDISKNSEIEVINNYIETFKDIDSLNLIIACLKGNIARVGKWSHMLTVIAIILACASTFKMVPNNGFKDFGFLGITSGVIIVLVLAFYDMFNTSYYVSLLSICENHLDKLKKRRRIR